jgi:hypothetical protein
VAEEVRYIGATGVMTQYRLIQIDHAHWCWEVVGLVAAPHGPYLSQAAALTAAEQWIDTIHSLSAIPQESG